MKVLLAVTSIAVMSLSSHSLAATVNSATYDASTKTVSVDLSYGGGCKEHVFKLAHGPCLEVFPVRCTMTLVDKTNDDFCEALISKTVEFKAADYGLLDAYFAGASITIEGDDQSAAFFSMPSGEEPATPSEHTITCPLGSNSKSIVFKPTFGEVHYLLSDGSEYKQHEDGMSFEELVLESNPPQIVMTITDDEQDRIGGWRFTSGAKKFSVTYRGKVYNSCVEKR